MGEPEDTRSPADSACEEAGSFEWVICILSPAERPVRFGQVRPLALR